MRRLSVLAFATLVSFLPALAQAQRQPPQPPPEEEEAEEEVEEDWEEEEEAEGEEPGLRPPQMENLEVSAAEDEEEVEEEGTEGDDEEDDELPSPGEAQQRLDEEDDGADPMVSRWTTPQTVVDLHGYLRLRGTFEDNFFFDRVNPNATYENQVGRGMVLPFALFRPLEDESDIDGFCGSGVGGDDPAEPCRTVHNNTYASMRLRLEPVVHLSDDVRVRMQIDVFDNMVLGSTPNSFAVGSALLSDGPNQYIDPYYRYERATFTPVDSTATTLMAPQAGTNSLTDSIVARRAWAEVNIRGLGEIRFGRMGNHWGLGILANGGRGIDSDYQTDVDRILLSTRIAGINIFGAWDFTSEGLVYWEPSDIGGIPYDRSRLDDVDQLVVGAAYQATEEDQAAAIQRGDAVFNIGAYFQYRNQGLTSAGTANPFGLCVVCDADGSMGTADATRRIQSQALFVRRGADVFVPDLWVQFFYEKLRLELEAAFVYGTIQNLSNTSFDAPDSGPAATLLQFAFAFEGEYHLLNDQLGIYFNAGYATGDADVEGLGRQSGLERQVPAGPDREADRTYSTYYFHPNYRVDLIFWRQVMRQVGGAYYLRPGISYDFIRNSFGQLLGARADVIWSRASEATQTWGNADDLGVELDVSVYYRSEDGPDPLDGFYAIGQWGIFFPLDGLGYLPGTPQPTGSTCTASRGCLGNAQVLRLILGVQY
jgi:uncharacterized protein (TIGR04551 family)